MRFRTKALIFLAAVLISLIGFGLVASPAVDIIVVGKKAGYQMITNFLAKTDLSVYKNSPNG